MADMTLSTLELTQLRSDVEDVMPDTCDLYVKSETIGSSGKISASWTETYSSVECLVVPVGARAAGQEIVQADQLSRPMEYVLTVPYDQTLAESMRVVHDSVVYEIVRMEDTWSQRSSKRAILVRVPNASA